MEQYRLGLIGCEGLPFDMLHDFTKALPVQLVAICAEGEQAERFMRHYQFGRQYTDYKEMLAVEQLDIVFIFDETISIFKAICDCLKAGAYVFAERPLCSSSEEANQLIQLQKETGCYVMARFNRREAPAYLMAKEIIQRKEFGTAKMFLAKYQSPLYASEKIFLWNHVSHILDTAVMLLGNIEITHVEKKVWEEKQYCYNIVFKTASGCTGVIQSGSVQCSEFPMERVEIAGDQCNVIIDNIRHLEYNRSTPDRRNGKLYELGKYGDTMVWNQNFGQMTSFSYYGIEGCAENLIRAAISKTRPSFDIEETIKTIALLEDIERIAGINE